MTINKLAQGVNSAPGPVEQNSTAKRVYPEEVSTSIPNLLITVTNIAFTPKAGSKVAARADVEIQLDTGLVKVYGLSIIDVHDNLPG